MKNIFLSNKNNILTLIIFGILFFILSINCSSHLVNQNSRAIIITHQNLYLAPIEGLDILESNKLWPKNNRLKIFLLNSMEQLYKNLLSEFRRCEKFGLYTMVDSTLSSTITINLTIQTSEQKHDTLFIPIIISTHHIASKKTESHSIESIGICPQDSSMTPLQMLGSTLADYQRNFPYQKIVKTFYAK